MKVHYSVQKVGHLLLSKARTIPHPPTLNFPDILASSNQEDNMSMAAIVNRHEVLQADHLPDLRVNGKIIFK
jgi:histidine ammonia-lyase